MTASVERWDVFEVALEGPSDGNPFVDFVFGAVFETEGRRVETAGFYDGDGVYRVRFMPDREGAWRYRVCSDRAELDGRTGTFNCSPPSPANHGPVGIAKRHHFSYADGTPFLPMGTTAYAWVHRPEEVRSKSLESFARYGFNKIRMLVFPKQYGDGKLVDISYQPPFLPFEGRPGEWDYSRPNPAFFRHYEDRVRELCGLGIEADVILFHPYDASLWRLPQGMTEADDLRYVEYLAARLSSMRNVWWSLANEYDRMAPDRFREKNWDRIGSRLAEVDPCGHPRSIHNWPFVDPYPDRTWMTHVSYQHPNTFSLLIRLKEQYGKPVINDEYQYEGEMPYDWGSCSPEIEVRRHWMATMAGGYATHGEVLKTGDSIKDYFWSYGGELQGGSPPRLAYMRKIVESCPFQDMVVDWRATDGRDAFCLAKDDDVYLYFITPEHKLPRATWIGPGQGPREEYEIAVHDVWECREVGRQTVKGGHFRGDLPPWAVLVARRIEPRSWVEEARKQ